MAGLETQPLSGFKSVTAGLSQGLQSEPAAQASRREVFLSNTWRNSSDFSQTEDFWLSRFTMLSPVMLCAISV